MGQKPSFWPNSKLFKKIFKKKTFHNLPFQGKLWPAIPRQQIELESCSNHVMTSGVVYFRIKKEKLIWLGGFGPMGS